MTYYFSLHNMNVENFYSPNWTVLGEARIFGGGVIIKTSNNGNKLFRCALLRKNDSYTLFEIDLSEDDMYNIKGDEIFSVDAITLIKLTDNKTVDNWTCSLLHRTTDFFGNVEEPYHYYHFAVNLKEKLILTNGREERVRSIRIRDILNDDRKTVELPVFNEGLMYRPDGTIYYVYSVKIPDKYVESFLIGRASFAKILYTSDSAMNDKDSILVIMYRSINGPKGLKDSMGLEIRQPSLKNMWQPKALPWEFITTKPECNITIDIPKDFIPHYSVADSKINRLEILKEMGMFESDKKVRIPEIKEVIFNYPATIVCWKDGTKTVVKCGKDETFFDREKAVAMCLIKKMLKPSKKCHWLDTIHDAIKVAEEKENKKAEAKDAKIIKEATNKAKAKQAKKNTAELQAAIQKLETKSLEEMNSKVEGKDEFEEKYKDIPVKKSKKESNAETLNTIAKENEKAINKGKKNKIDLNVLVDCIKEDLTIDEIAEMNSWDKAAVARLYYKMTGTRPKKKDNTYSELDNLFEQGVSIDAAARRTGFSKNIVAMRYAKLQGKKSKG